MMIDEYFTCPKCGSHYFGRETECGPDGEAVILDTVKCHGGEERFTCDWRGTWDRPSTPSTSRLVVEDLLEQACEDGLVLWTNCTPPRKTFTGTEALVEIVNRHADHVAAYRNWKYDPMRDADLSEIESMLANVETTIKQQRALERWLDRQTGVAWGVLAGTLFGSVCSTLIWWLLS